MGVCDVWRNFSLCWQSMKHAACLDFSFHLVPVNLQKLTNNQHPNIDIYVALFSIHSVHPVSHLESTVYASKCSVNQISFCIKVCTRGCISLYNILAVGFQCAIVWFMRLHKNEKKGRERKRRAFRNVHLSTSNSYRIKIILHSVSSMATPRCVHHVIYLIRLFVARFQLYYFWSICMWVFFLCLWTYA